MKTAFPYRVLSGDVRLQVDQVFIDNRPIGIMERINDRDQVVALHDLKETNERWSELRLKVSVTAEKDELTTGPWRDPSCIVVVRNRKGNVYHAFSLSPDGPGRWIGEAELRREEHVGRSRIDACIVATVGGIEGRLVGEAQQPWDIDFEAKRPTPERSLRMRWIDFTEHDHLKEYRDDPWLLDTEVGEPILYLNSAVDGLRGILDQAVGTEQKLVQEILSSQVAAEAWSALFNASLYACQMEGTEAQWPGGWHEDVLRRMLPDLYPNLPPDQALTELIEARREGENGSDLQRRLIHASGVQSRKPRKISTVLRDLRRMANKKEPV